MLPFAILLTISQIIAAYLLFRHEARKNSQLEHHSDLLALRLKALALQSIDNQLADAVVIFEKIDHDITSHLYRITEPCI